MKIEIEDMKEKNELNGNTEYANPPLQLRNYWQGNNKTEYE